MAGKGGIEGGHHHVRKGCSLPARVHSLQGLQMVMEEPTIVSTAMSDRKSATTDLSALLSDSTLQRHVTVLPCCSLCVISTCTAACAIDHCTLLVGNMLLCRA